MALQALVFLHRVLCCTLSSLPLTAMSFSRLALGLELLAKQQILTLFVNVFLFFLVKS
jgi:hypothetical protein